MRQTKRVWQRRRNAFIALIIVLAILTLLHLLCYTYIKPLGFIMGFFTGLVLIRFPWYKFK